MALSEAAIAVKQTLQNGVILRRELEALQEEFRQLVQDDVLYGEDLIWQLLLQKRRLQKALAKATLKNWVKLRQAGLSERQFSLMKMRYVQGKTWREILEKSGCSKPYALRQHNRALEKMAGESAMMAA